MPALALPGLSLPTPSLPALALAAPSLAVEAPPVLSLPKISARDGSGIPGFSTPFSQDANGVWHVTTNLASEDNGVWFLGDADGDKYIDLIYIKTRNTASGMVEVHAAAGSSVWKDWTTHAVSRFTPEDNGVWTMAAMRNRQYPGGDLVYIKTRNTSSGQVEVHASSSTSGYKDMLTADPSVFSTLDDANGVFTMMGMDSFQLANLAFIKTNNTGTGMTELHVASADSSYKESVQATGTGFQQNTGGRWNIDRSGTRPVLVRHMYNIRTSNTPSGKVEVQVADESRGYQDRQTPKVTPFAANSPGTFLVSHVLDDYKETTTCGIFPLGAESYHADYLVNIDTSGPKVKLSFFEVVADASTECQFG